MMIIAQMAEPEKATILNFSPKKNLKTWVLHFVEGLEAWRRRSHKIVDSDAKVPSTVTAGIRGPTAKGQVHSGGNFSFYLDKMSPGNKASNCVRCHSGTISHC